MIRRTMLVVATVVLAGATVAPGALAAPQDWSGSQVTMPSPPDGMTSSSFSVQSLIVRAYNPDTHRVDATSELLAPAEQEAGCTTSVGPTTVQRLDGNRHSASAPAQVNCNGSYVVRVTARLIQRFTFGGGEREVDTYVLPEHTIHVIAPPPDVTAVATAPGDDRSVVVGWTPVANPPPDLLGYHIERVSASGETVTIATLDDPDASSYTDENPPAEGGETTYRVRARRSSPQGEISSARAGEATAQVEPAPAQPGDPGTDPDPDGSGGGEDGGGTSTPGGGAGPGTTSGPRSTGGTRFRPPTVGRSSGRVVPPLSGTVTTLDTGFEEELPFGERELGEEDPVLPDDEFASMIYEDEAGRGLLIPIATALLLAVWAVHLRYLAAAAKPE